MRDQPHLHPSARLAVTVNGSVSSMDRGTTVMQLLHQLEITPDRVAVEINLAVIDRSTFAQTVIQEGDRVEIVSFVGGGYG